VAYGSSPHFELRREAFADPKKALLSLRRNVYEQSSPMPNFRSYRISVSQFKRLCLSGLFAAAKAN
jgi:hypothetical protein